LNSKKVLVILGSGLDSLYRDSIASEFDVNTKYGTVTCADLNNSAETILLYRHGKNHKLPPHLVNYRANIQSAKNLGVDFILATAAVGAIIPTLSIGTFVVPDQFLDFTRSRAVTFFDEKAETFSHTDMTSPYSEIVRSALIENLKSRGYKFRARGTYVCTQGPRYETKAEIRMFRMMGGDIVGMTGVPEVVLANEIGIPYGSLAYVTNRAAGMQPKIDQGEVQASMLEASKKFESVITAVIGKLTNSC
jgi:5'-methylthioadenosine phosphorylase